MTRLMCVVLALVLIFSMFTTVHANVDEISCLDDLSYKFDVLSGVGILPENFDSLSFNEPLTRAEVVDIIIKLCSYEFDVSISESYFMDVNSDTDFVDSINKAAAQGIVKGEDSMFYPSNQITFIDACVYFMRALGYGEYAEVNGGYPYGYLKALQFADLKKYANLFSDDIMTQGDFISMLYDVIGVPVVEKKIYGGDAIDFKKTNSMLEYFHDIVVVTGRVNATYITALSGHEVLEDENKIKINNRLYSVPSKEFCDFLGYYVDVYYKNTEDNDYDVLYITKSYNCDELIISADDILDFEDLTYKYGDKNKTVKVDENHTLIVNGKRKSVYGKEDFIPKNGKVILIGKNGIYDTVIVNYFENYFLQRMLVGGDDKLSITEKESLRRFTIDLYDETLVEVYKDDVKIDMQPFSYNIHGRDYYTTGFDDIPQGSVASVFADKFDVLNGMLVPSNDADVIRIYVYTPQIYGKLNSYSKTHIIVNDVKYEIASDNKLDDLKIGSNGYFVNDFDGKIYSYYDNSVKDVSYAYLINAAIGKGLNEKMQVKLMTDDGYVKIYNLIDKVRVNDKVEKDHTVVYSLLQQTAKSLDQTFKISQPIKVKFDEQNNVSEIWTVAELKNANTLYRDCKRQVWNTAGVGGMLQQDGTAEYLNPVTIFAVPDVETFDDEDYRIFWGNQVRKTIDIFDVNEHRVPALVVSYEKLSDSSLYRDIIMVGDIITELDDEGNVVSVIKGYDGYGEVYYYSDNMNLFDGLIEGDVIQIKGHHEKINSWRHVLKIEQVKNHNYSSGQNFDANGLYEVYSVKDRDLVFQKGEFIQDSYSGQRLIQVCARWINEPGSFTYGAVCYDGAKRDDKICSFNITDGVPDVLKTVTNVGNENATKAYIIVYGGMLNYIALYNNVNGDSQQ